MIHPENQERKDRVIREALLPSGSRFPLPDRDPYSITIRVSGSSDTMGAVLRTPFLKVAFAPSFVTIFGRGMSLRTD
jgi:hypothetical protein